LTNLEQKLKRQLQEKDHKIALLEETLSCREADNNQQIVAL
jgi:hypothetical protein